MIQLKTIKWKNMFSYGNKWNTFTFKEGLSFISGKNVLTGRRNFTGKSSFLKIVQFALFGKVEGINKKQIINWKNKKNAEVILTFENKSIEYIIHRGIVPDIFSVMKNNIEIPQSSNKKIFQQEIEDSILKMDHTTFMNIVYCDTNNTISILNASKPIKRNYLEKLFNLSYFSKLKDIANIKKKGINDNIIDINSEIKTLNSKMILLKNNITSYNDDLKKHNINIKKIKENINILNISEGREQKILDKQKEIKDKQDIINNEVSKKKILIEKIKGKIFHLSKFKVNEVYNGTERINSLTNELNEITIDLNNFKEEMVDINIKKIKENINSFTDKMNELNSELKLKKFQCDESSKEIDILNNNFKNSPKEGKCPTCMQSVDFNILKDEYRKLLDNKIILSDILKKDIILLKTDKVLNDTNLKSLKKEENIYNDLVNNIDEKQIKQTNISKKFKELEKQIMDYNKSVKYQNAIKRLDKVIYKITKEIVDIPSFENPLKIIDKKLIECREEKQQYIKLTDQLNNIDNSVITLNGYILNSQKEITDTNNHIIKFDKSLKKYNNMIEYIKQVIIICGDDKCKQYAISNFLPYFNERINYYLGKSGVLFYLKLTGWLDYEILGPGIKNCSYDNLSGAERISVDRAIQLSSMDVKKQQSSALIDVLILDEVLDSSVDDIGLQDMMSIIKAKQEEDNSKVLVVSHRNELGTLNSEFDYKYIVTMDKYSTIKEL